MFCDLVGSTALSARLDPEDLRKVIGAYQSCVSTVIERFGGSTHQNLGDGTLVFFGYPTAHEDDAEQAVRAGLELVEAVTGLEPLKDLSLEVRVGVATGRVVVSEEENAVFGETPNLAKRLQELAEPSAVMICPGTRRLTWGHFTCLDQPTVSLKGFKEVVAVSQVLGAIEVESRFEARHGKKLAPLLGRSEEIELLLRRWRDAAQGKGRVVVLTGEPGIGKSHIALAVRDLLQQDPHTILRYFCSEHHVNSALFPFVNQIKRAAHFDHDDLPDQKISKLEALLSPSSDRAEYDVALLGSLLSVPLGEHQRLPDWSPQKRKERIFELLLGELGELAAQQPVLVIFEDAHWIDPTSLELLTSVVKRSPSLPIMVIVTARADEFKPPWDEDYYVRTLPLSRLEQPDQLALIEQVTAGAPLPPDLKTQILKRAGGVPLYIEELTKAIVDSGALDEDRWRHDMGNHRFLRIIPENLQSTLISRLDRLAPVRELAQIGAVVGQEFSYEILTTVGQFSRKSLDDALDALVGSGLVFCRGEKPHAIYTFKHALVRDAAYEELLKSRRIELHGDIANALEQQFPEVVEGEPETVAHHLAEAGQAERAISYWLKAAGNAAGRSANREAVAHLQRGIANLDGFADGPEKDRLELDLNLALAPCLIALYGPASTMAIKNFGRARDLCERLEDPPEYLKVMFWLTTSMVVRGELKRAEEAIDTLLSLARARCDRPVLLNALRGRAMILLFLGAVGDARDTANRAVHVFNESAESEQLAARSAGQDAAAAGLALESWALWILGHVDEAVAQGGAAVERADEVKDPHTQAYVYYYASVLHAFLGDMTVAHAFADKCLGLSEEHEFKSWRSLARALCGICTATASSSRHHFDEVAAALSDYRREGFQLGITALYALMCSALLRSGQTEAAFDVVEEGLATADQNSERLFQAELLRQKAKVLVAGGDPDDRTKAQAVLEQALEVAKRQHARSIEFRVASDLAALWLNQGSRSDARDLLTPLYDEFIGSMATHDLKHAKALLDQLH